MRVYHKFSDSEAGEVIFGEVTDVFLALDVISDGFFDEEGILHIV